MNTQTRHALQQDAFATTTLTGLDWVAANRGRVLRIALLALAVLLAIVAAVTLYNQRSHAAETALGDAMNTYSTPIADPAQPAPPGVKTFATTAERAKAARPQFLAVADKYGSMEAGENARYFAGLTAAEMGNNSEAETQLKKVAGAHNGNIAALGRFALANLLAGTGRNADAVKLYQDLISHPTTAVPAASAQLQLAQLYQATNPAEATRILTTLKDKDKTSAASEIAAQRLSGNTSGAAAPAGPRRPASPRQ